MTVSRVSLHDAVQKGYLVPSPPFSLAAMTNDFRVKVIQDSEKMHGARNVGGPLTTSNAYGFRAFETRLLFSNLSIVNYNRNTIQSTDINKRRTTFLDRIAVRKRE